MGPLDLMNTCFYIDALPSVKKWKKFSKNVELLKRAMEKKDDSKMKTAYAVALDSLDAYLEEVELPSALELKQQL